MTKNDLALVGVKEAGDMLGVSKQYVHMLVRDKRLKPALKLACGNIFWIKDVEAVGKTLKHYKK